jgi:hypothetical protein
MGSLTDSEGACLILAERFEREVYEMNSLHQLVKTDKLRAFVFKLGQLVQRQHGVETRGRDLLFLKSDLSKLAKPKVGRPAKKQVA